VFWSVFFGITIIVVEGFRTKFSLIRVPVPDMGSIVITYRYL